MEVLVSFIVFVAVVALIVGGYLYVNRGQLERTAVARSRLLNADLQVSEGATSILKDTTVSAVPMFDRFLSGKSVVDQLTDQLSRGGISMKAGSFLLLVAVCGALGLFFGSLFGLGILSAIVGIIFAALPLAWLKWKQGKRLKTFQEQLPEAIDMLVSAMKAGYSFQAAMKFIGEESAAPLGSEFGRFYEEQRLGMEVKAALLNLQERVGSLDLKMLVTAIIIQRETGGNLSEVLNNISELMRQRAAMRGEIETLTAESKLSARILSCLPGAVFLAVYMMDPQYMGVMFRFTAGKIMLLVGIIMILSGYSAMMKIANIDI